MCCSVGRVMLVVVAVVVSFDTDLPFTAAAAGQVVPCVAWPASSVCQDWDIFTDADSRLISLRRTRTGSGLSCVNIGSLDKSGQRTGIQQREGEGDKYAAGVKH